MHWALPRLFVLLCLLVRDVGSDNAACVRRASEGNALSTSHRPAVGIILIICDEPLDFLLHWRCSTHSITLYVYNKCDGNSHPALQHLKECTAYVKTVTSELSTELSGMKHHAEYLDWVIEHYNDGLHRMNFFLKGTFPKALNYKDPSRINVTDVLEEVTSAKYAFKSFGHIKITAMKSEWRYYWHWQAELCAMFARYSCEDLCKRKKMGQVWWNRGTTYAISGSRIRTLPQSEYVWLRQYINSLVPGSRSIKRRFVMERIWQLMLGCPEDALQGQPAHCPHGSIFPSGKRIAPPSMLLKHGIISQDGGRTGAPERNSLWYMTDKTAAPILFVAAMVDRPALKPLYTVDGESELQLLWKRVFRLIARIHKNYSFAFLTDTETVDNVFTPSYWSGTARIFRYDIPGTTKSCGADNATAAHAAYGSIRAQLESRFLADLRNGRIGDPPRNMVLLNPFSIFAGDVSSVFEKYSHSGVALPTFGLQDDLVPMLTWYVRPSGIAFAFSALQEVSRQLAVTSSSCSAGRYLHDGRSYESLLRNALSCCYTDWKATQDGGAGSSVDCGTISCSKVERASGVKLPCDVYGASVGIGATAGGGIIRGKKGSQQRTASTNNKGGSCEYRYGHSLVAHLHPEDATWVSNAAKKMFCMYTAYCDGKLKGNRYHLRAGERRRMKGGAD